MHIARVTDDLKAYLNSTCNLSDCVQLLEYGQERNLLKDYLTKPNTRVWVGTEYTNQALYELIPEVNTHSVTVTMITVLDTHIVLKPKPLFFLMSINCVLCLES